MDNWQTLGKKLAENYLVYLVDLRNHGKSPHSDSFSYLEMANDIAELIDDENLTDVNLIGHSMGGKTAMTFSTEFPHLLKSLTVVDIAPKKYPPHHDEILDALFSLNLDEHKIAWDKLNFLTTDGTKSCFPAETAPEVIMISIFELILFSICFLKKFSSLSLKIPPSI